MGIHHGQYPLRMCLKHLKLSSTTYFVIFLFRSWCPSILRHISCFSLQPLSTMLWRRPPKEPPEADSGADPGTYSPPHSDLEASRDGPVTPYNIFSGFALPQWAPTRSSDKIPPDPYEKTEEPPEEMSIAVMIAMPCSVNARRATYEGTDITRLTECQIGTTIVPWHPEVSSTLLPVLSRTTTTPQNL